MNCKNCTSVIQGSYCAHCGHASKLSRIDGQFILHEMGNVLQFEKGLLFTIKELVVNPGQCVRGYLYENRSRLVKPIVFIILTSLFYTLVANFFHHEVNSINGANDKNLTAIAISNWVHTHYDYANIIMGLFIACWLKLLFRKHNVNFFEILLLLSYVMGVGMLLLAIAVFLNGVTGHNFMSLFSVITFIYLSWAIGQFFEQRNLMTFIKAGAAYALGFTTFAVGAWLLGLGYDAIMK